VQTSERARYTQNQDFQDDGSRLARGLGWFSIGLGLAEVAAPRAVARLIGIREDDNTNSVMRAMGSREIANGVAILAQPDRARWLWSRVGGDVVDLSALGAAFNAEDADHRRLTAATMAVLGVTALDVLCAGKMSVRGGPERASRPHGVRVEEVTTINRPIEEVYGFWRNFENLPRFMRHLESVQTIDERRSRWRAKAPAGMTVEWEAELVQDVRDEWIAWRSIEGSGIRNSGSVRFGRAPGARGTEVRVQLEYSPPAGALGRGIAYLFGEEPEQQIHEDLHRFKQLMETGEIPLSEGFGLWRAAQPSTPERIKSLAGVH
jgi:uncharacterized membrane protein